MNPVSHTSQSPRLRLIATAGILALAAGSAQAAVQAADGQMTSSQAPAAGSDADQLAQKLANPIAAMISVPFQNNFDWGGGPRGDGFQYKMNIQPVIPFKLNDTWNLITRTIIPVIQQDDIAGTYARPSGSQFGLGDTSISAWLSPIEPTSNGWIWGVGPSLLLPTGTDTMLTANQWAAGPTVIVLKQDGKFTYGALASHTWSFAGRGGSQRVNLTFFQPFFAYNPGGGWTYALNTESSYDWTGEQWTIPINLMVSKMIKLGKMPAQLQLGIRYYADAPDNGPDWGARLGLTLLFPE